MVSPEEEGAGLRRLLRVTGGRGLLWLLAGTLGGLAVSTADLGAAWLLGHLLALLQRAPSPGSPGELGLGALLALLVGVGLLRALAQILLRQGASTTHELIAARLRLLGLQGLLGDAARPSLPAARLHHEIHEVFPRAARFCRLAAEASGALLHGLVLVAAMTFIAPAEAGLSLLGLALVAVFVARIHRATTGAATRMLDEHRRLTGGIERVARNWLLVRVLRTHREERRRLETHVTDYGRQALRATLRANLGAFATSIGGLGLFAAVLYVAAALHPSAPAELVPFFYLLLRLTQVASRLATVGGAAMALLPHFARAAERVAERSPAELERTSERLRDLRPFRRLRHTPPPPEDAPSIAARSQERRHPPVIRLRDLGFRYGEGSRQVLRGLHLELPSGGRLAITGPSGAGKSTLLALIAGVLEPSSGAIELSGIDAASYAESHARSLGFVGAEPYLIEGSVRANLCYGLRGEASDIRLWDSLARARLEPTIRELPEGLSALIAADGLPLSSGERQRLCLARALLRDPTLLLLDEPTANLDLRTEAEILATLDRLQGRCTVVVATHRRGLLAGADAHLDLGIR